MVKSLFLSGHDTVILDADVSRDYRLPWELLGKKEGFKIKYVLFTTPVDVCIERARLSGRNDLIDVVHKNGGTVCAAR